MSGRAIASATRSSGYSSATCGRSRLATASAASNSRSSRFGVAKGATIERQLSSIPPELTRLHEHIRQHEQRADAASGFETGLDLLLDALQRRLRRALG